MEVGLPIFDHDSLSLELGNIDVGIVGGGIAGLSLAIKLVERGHSVTVFEKANYPRHKVCGEYISNESRAFLKDLGIDISQLHLPEINKFRITDRFGNKGECDLNPGGFGWSRYRFDKSLLDRALELGVNVRTSMRIKEYKTGFNGFVKVEGEEVLPKVVFNATGRSVEEARGKVPWVGVKYHTNQGPESNAIEIHAFEGGYCGTSRIENDLYCLCYLVKSEQLKKHGSIEALEEKVLGENIALKKRLSYAKVMGPITTSQFYFGLTSDRDPFSIGDAAGFIPPLTGNGMSLALRSAKMAYESIIDVLDKKVTEVSFTRDMHAYQINYLRPRISKGTFLQDVLNIKPDMLNNLIMRSFGVAPFALKQMTKLAVGKTI